jgi:hypothetical protein
MRRTVGAEIDEHGQIRLLKPLTVTHPSRVLVTILPSHPKEENETALLSEASLAVDWNRVYTKVWGGLCCKLKVELGC